MNTTISVFERHTIEASERPKWQITPAELVEWIATGRNPKRGDVEVQHETLKGADLALKLTAHYGGKAGAKAARKRVRECAAAHEPPNPTDAEADGLLTAYEQSKNRKPAAMQGEAEARSRPIAHSGIAIADLDGLLTREAAESARDTLGALPQTQCAWLSSSRHGAQARIRIDPNPGEVARATPADTLLRLDMNADMLTAALHAEAFTEAVEPWIAELGLGVALDGGYKSNAKFHAVSFDPDIVATYMDGDAAIAWDSAAALERLTARKQKRQRERAEATDGGAGDMNEHGYTPADYAEALFCINPSDLDHDDVVRVCAAAKAAGVSEDEARRWAAERREDWLDANRWTGLPSDRITAGTLIYEAKARGYAPPKRARGRAGANAGASATKRASPGESQNARVWRWLSEGADAAGFSVIGGTRANPMAGSVANSIAALYQIGLGRGFRYNEWRQRLESADGGAIRLDEAATDAQVRIERAGEFAPTREALQTAIQYIAKQGAYNPVREWFAALPAWDSVKRLDRLAPRFSADDTELNNATLGLIPRAVYARCMSENYVHFDYAAILYSQRHGKGKTRALGILAIDREFYREGVELDGYDAQRRIQERMRGATIIELAEIGGLTRREMAKLKALLTDVELTNRLAYERGAQTDRIRSVIAGTTNTKQMLVDEYNRRFPVVEVAAHGTDADGTPGAPIDLPWLQANLKQIYAEVAALYADGLPAEVALPVHLRAAANANSEQYRETGAFEDWAAEYLLGSGGFSEIGATALLEAFNQANVSNRTPSNAERSSAMQRLGYERAQVKKDGRNARVWRRKVEPPAHEPHSATPDGGGDAAPAPAAGATQTAAATPDAFAAIPPALKSEWRSMSSAALSAELKAYRASGDAECEAAIEQILQARGITEGFADMRRPHRTD